MIRYPGCACDIPSQVYSYSFAPNPDWSRTFTHPLTRSRSLPQPQPDSLTSPLLLDFYSTSSEIQAYFKAVAVRYGVPSYVAFERKVTAATWDEKEGLWRLIVENIATGERTEDFADLLINASGILK